MKRNNKKNHSLSKDLIDNLMRDFDLKVKGFKEVRNAYRIDTNRGKKLLKRAKINEDELKQVYEALEYLARKGFRKTSRFIITKYGDPYVRNGNELYYLTDWIDGKECKLHKSKLVEEAIRTIAEFHLASIGFNNSQQNKHNKAGKWQDLFYKRSNELLQLKEMVKENKYLTQFDELFLANVDNMYEYTQRAIELLILSDYRSLSTASMERGGFCHYGLSSRNLIKNKNGIYIVDLDNLKFDLHLLDLGKFMLKYLPKYQFDLNVANTVIYNYSNVNEIDKQQMEVLTAYLIYPHRFWRVVHRYYNKQNQWSEVAFVKKLEKAIREYDDLFNFVKKFSEENKIDLTNILNKPIENNRNNLLEKETTSEEGINITDYIEVNKEDNFTDGEAEREQNETKEEFFESP